MRTISALRRVGLAKRLANEARIKPEGWVQVSVVDAPRQALLLAPTEEGDPNALVRDPTRPRRVNTMLQVTLPTTYMEQVSLRPGQDVYLTWDSRAGAVRVEAAADLKQGVA